MPPPAIMEGEGKAISAAEAAAYKKAGVLVKHGFFDAREVAAMQRTVREFKRSFDEVQVEASAAFDRLRSLSIAFHRLPSLFIAFNHPPSHSLSAWTDRPGDPRPV